MTIEKTEDDHWFVYVYVVVGIANDRDTKGQGGLEPGQQSLIIESGRELELDIGVQKKRRERWWRTRSESYLQEERT